jgi:hypothetical protein
MNFHGALINKLSPPVFGVQVHAGHRKIIFVVSEFV